VELLLGRKEKPAMLKKFTRWKRLDVHVQMIEKQSYEYDGFPAVSVS
jgi:hypothetical protein